ncbi:hypothetical protein BH10ACI4_BH10ACI4_16940 [soil metagenome]
MPKGPYVAAFVTPKKRQLMISKTLIEQRNKLMHDAGTLMQGSNITAEIRNKFDAMMADADVLDADIKRTERTEAFEAEQRSATRPPRGNPGEQRTEGDERTKSEKRAFSDWVRTGTISAENRAFLRTQQIEQRDLGVGTPGANGITGGSVLVPVGFDPQLNIAQKSYGAIVGAVRQFNTDGGEGIRVSLANDTTQGLTVIGEAVAVSENDPALSGFTSYTDTLTTGMVRVSNQLLQDSAFNVEQFIQESFGQRYYRGLAQMITQGNGSNIASIVSGATVAVTLATGGATSIAYSNLVDLYAALDPAYLDSSSFVMNSTTRANLMKLTDSYGRPLLQSDVNGVPFNSIFGRPILISQYSDNMTANKVPILFGDLAAGYTYRKAGNIAIRRLDERYAELNETAFLGFVRCGGYTTDAGTHPIVSLKMAAS